MYIDLSHVFHCPVTPTGHSLNCPVISRKCTEIDRCPDVISTSDLNVYTGASGGRETALGEKVVLKLSDSIKGRHHQLFFDNYFTSVNLLSTLLANGTYACGTIRTNRKQYPAEISEEVKKLSRGQFVFRQSGNLVATAWKDNKVVNMASTLARPDDHTTVDRRQKDGTRRAVQCPLCVALYNRFMGVWTMGTI